MKIPGRVRRRRTNQASDAAAMETAAPEPWAPDSRAAEAPPGGALTGEVARLAGELAEEASPPRWRRFQVAATRLVRRGGQAGRTAGQAGRVRATAGGRWLTAQVLAMAPGCRSVTRPRCAPSSRG